MSLTLQGAGPSPGQTWSRSAKFLPSKGPRVPGPLWTTAPEAHITAAFVALTAVTAQRIAVSVQGCVCWERGAAQPSINTPKRLMMLSALKRRIREWETNWGDQWEENSHNTPAPQLVLQGSASPWGPSLERCSPHLPASVSP